MNKTARLALPLMFCSGLLLGGCQKENPETGDLSQQQQEDAEVMKQLETPPVNNFRLLRMMLTIFSYWKTMKAVF
ncbi:hypothetical protein J520_0043 [Acinetobacter sp. 869535]|nr:hypothetical protein [Acinetobacter sp. 869535]EXC34768.1 hypothetical protein J520_0043 [Acinetobacter sp. 869535]